MSIKLQLKERNSKGQNVGYIRVSSADQNTDRQLNGLKLDKIFTDKASGKDTKRPQLQECLRFLREGDCLHVHSMDRLARSLADLLRIVEELTKSGISIKFENERLTFTGEDSPMQSLQLAVMGAVAQFERAMIKERQREGIAAYKAKGGHFGPKPKLSEKDITEIKTKIALGAEKKALAAEYGISRARLYQLLAN